MNRNDIAVSKPSSGLSVTYRKTGRVLVALDSMRRDPKGEELMSLPSPRLSRLAGSTDLNAAWWLTAAFGQKLDEKNQSDIVGVAVLLKRLLSDGLKSSDEP